MEINPLGRNDVAWKPIINQSYINRMINHFDAFYLQTTLQSENINQHFINETVPSPVNTLRIPNQAEVIPDNKSSAVAINPLRLSSNHIIKTTNDFVNTLWPYAKQAAIMIGVEPKLLIAQAALETGWGKYIARDKQGISSNNLFNIKAPSHCESAIAVHTTEFVDNLPIKITASFKAYPSMAESFQDYITLITTNPRYHLALANANQPEQYAQALQAAGYATDPDYANKVLAIYHGVQ